MRRSERFCERSQWTRATSHPFVRALVEGTLPEDNFARYLIQDYAFVETLVDVVSYVTAHAPDMERKRRFVDFLHSITGPENTYFQESFAALKVPEAAWQNPKLKPVTEQFRHYLLSTAGLGSYAEGLSVLLPVEWVYLTWASELPDDPPAFDPYRQWIEIHASPEFRSFVLWMRDELDRLTLSEAQEKKLQAHFQRTVDFEVRFWQMSWKRDDETGAR